MDKFWRYMGGALPAMLVPDFKPIPDAVKPSGTIGRAVKAVWFECGTFERQVENEQSGLWGVRWLASSHGNAVLPEQQFRCIRRTAAPEACSCLLLAGWGKHLETQSDCPAALVPARRLKLKSKAANMTACFFITGSDEADYIILFWYGIFTFMFCQANFLNCIFLAGAHLYKTHDHSYIYSIR